LGRDAVDAAALGVTRDRRADFGLWVINGMLTNGADADGEIVWSWRLDAGVKSCGGAYAQPGGGAIFRKATVTRKPIAGESTE
jgi:hypothetical protein